MSTAAITLDDLISREEIRNILVRYCIGVDQRNAEMIKSVYWPDAHDDHGVFCGPAYEFADLNVEMARKHTLLTHHLVGNFCIEIEGENAQVDSYVIAYHRIRGDGESVRSVLGESYFSEYGKQNRNGHDYLAGGRYRDHFQRRQGEWRILKRVALADWDMLQPSSALWQEGLFRDAYHEVQPAMAPEAPSSRDQSNTSSHMKI